MERFREGNCNEWLGRVKPTDDSLCDLLTTGLLQYTWEKMFLLKHRFYSGRCCCAVISLVYKLFVCYFSEIIDPTKCIK